MKENSKKAVNAKVVLCKCSRTKGVFGIRLEERDGDWLRTWAFKIDERKAKREGFEANTVTGSMNADAGYPGCPYCGGQGFIQCGCGKTSCDGGVFKYDSNTKFTCPWCGNSGELVNVNSFDVSGGSY
jgi:hypothetical protein